VLVGALVALALTSQRGMGPFIAGDSGLKGHLFWFAGATLLTLFGPIVAWFLSRRELPAFSGFCLVLLTTLLFQIVCEALFINLFFKNMVNPVALGFIALRVAFLSAAAFRFRAAPVWMRAFIAANLVFWSANALQQLIGTTPRVLS
jgi:hypothetical protein